MTPGPVNLAAIAAPAERARMAGQYADRHAVREMAMFLRFWPRGIADLGRCIGVALGWRVAGLATIGFARIGIATLGLSRRRILFFGTLAIGIVFVRRRAERLDAPITARAARERRDACVQLETVKHLT